MGRGGALGQHQGGMNMATAKKTRSTTKPAVRSQAFHDGVAMRSKVLGPDYVAGAFRGADDINAPFQEIATEMAWGKVWTRPGLTLRERSMLTLAFCIALNRPNEIRIHLRGAIRNGVTRIEVRELILHSFLYCGGPAALDAYKTVREAWPDIEAAEKRLAAKTTKKRATRARK
jgi:4-carboxymuconolactone decarboxylase